MTSSQPSSPVARAERALAALARLATPLLAPLLALPPLRGLLHRRAARAWRSTSEPLVLCYGNINRSPFAAELARAASAEQARRPRSAGLYPEAGRPASELARAEARRRGIDLEGHRSVLVSPQQLRDAGAIFVFDLENAVRVAARNPSALARTHLFASLSPEGAPIVPDPHGREPEVAARAFAQIAAAVDALPGR